MLPPGSVFSAYRKSSVIVNFEDKKYEISYFTCTTGSDLFNEITRTLLHGEDATLYELKLSSGRPFYTTLTIPFEGLHPSVELLLRKSASSPIDSYVEAAGLEDSLDLSSIPRQPYSSVAIDYIPPETASALPPTNSSTLPPPRRSSALPLPPSSFVVSSRRSSALPLPPASSVLSPRAPPLSPPINCCYSVLPPPPLDLGGNPSFVQPMEIQTVTGPSVAVPLRPIKVFGWYEKEHSYEKPVDVQSTDPIAVVKERYFQVGVNHDLNIESV